MRLRSGCACVRASVCVRDCLVHTSESGESERHKCCVVHLELGEFRNKFRKRKSGNPLKAYIHTI